MLKIVLSVIEVLVIYAFLGGPSLESRYRKFTDHEKCIFNMLLILIVMSVFRGWGGELG